MLDVERSRRRVAHMHEDAATARPSAVAEDADMIVIDSVVNPRIWVAKAGP